MLRLRSEVGLRAAPEDLCSPAHPPPGKTLQVFLPCPTGTPGPPPPIPDSRIHGLQGWFIVPPLCPILTNQRREDRLWEGDLGAPRGECLLGNPRGGLGGCPNLISSCPDSGVRDSVQIRRGPMNRCVHIHLTTPWPSFTSSCVGVLLLVLTCMTVSHLELK